MKWAGYGGVNKEARKHNPFYLCTPNTEDKGVLCGHVFVQYGRNSELNFKNMVII